MGLLAAVFGVNDQALEPFKTLRFRDNSNFSGRIIKSSLGAASSVNR
jgi:hypothetical protein